MTLNHPFPAQVILDGYLATQPAKGGRDDPWPLRFYALTSSALYKAKDQRDGEALNVYLMEPTCSVWPRRGTRLESDVKFKANSKGSRLGRLPLASAELSTSDHGLEA